MSHTVNDGDSSNGHDFGFAFNEIVFSDRELNIEIIEDDSLIFQIQPQSNDINSSNNTEALQCDVNSSCSEDNSRITKSTKLHVNSVILAAKSPFFRKLLTNGMMESGQRCATIRIHADEENAFMELLKYMYNGTLTSTTAPDLLHLLKAAEKFQVDSCMRLCTSLLTKLPLSLESALLYLDFASTSLSKADVVEPLTDAAKQFFTANYKDFHENECKIMELPLEAVEAIISSNDLRVTSEDLLFDFALKWTTHHYPDPEDQRKILSTRLYQCIRFPHMSPKKLSEVLSCNKLDRDFARKVVLDALFYKANTHHHYTDTKATFTNPDGPFAAQRTYHFRPTKVVRFESPWPELVMYLEVKLDECVNLYPSGGCLYFEPFSSNGERFFFVVWGRKLITYDFGAGLVMKPYKATPLAVDYVISARTKQGRDFVVLNRGSGNFSGAKYIMLYSCSFSDGSMEGKDLDFIDGILYLKLDLRMKL